MYALIYFSIGTYMLECDTFQWLMNVLTMHVVKTLCHAHVTSTISSVHVEQAGLEDFVKPVSPVKSDLTSSNIENR